jgi:hypothetical protein
MNVAIEDERAGVQGTRALRYGRTFRSLGVEQRRSGEHYQAAGRWHIIVANRESHE